jgi:hypothetical protein
MSRPAIPIRDRTGREIMIGDVLKVLHFIGARRKRHYMYKHVLRQITMGSVERGNVSPYFFLSHLNLREDEGYHLPLDGSWMERYEIVSSIDAKWEDRPRVMPPVSKPDVQIEQTVAEPVRTMEHARIAKRELITMCEDMPGIGGIGIGSASDGSGLAVTVNVVDEETASRIPHMIGIVPVNTYVTELPEAFDGGFVPA